MYFFFSIQFGSLLFRPWWSWPLPPPSPARPPRSPLWPSSPTCPPPAFLPTPSIWSTCWKGPLEFRMWVLVSDTKKSIMKEWVFLLTSGWEWAIRVYIFTARLLYDSTHFVFDRRRSLVGNKGLLHRCLKFIDLCAPRELVSFVNCRAVKKLQWKIREVVKSLFPS